MFQSILTNFNLLITNILLYNSFVLGNNSKMYSEASNINQNPKYYSKYSFTKILESSDYYQPEKNESIQRLKLKYDCKPISNKFLSNLLKLPSDTSSLRQTYNTGCNLTSRNQKDENSLFRTTYKPQRAQNNLRNTVHYTNFDKKDSQYFLSASPNFIRSYKKYSVRNDSKQQENYSSTKNQFISDETKVSQKINNNTKILDQIKKLKDQKWTRKQNKYSNYYTDKYFDHPKTSTNIEFQKGQLKNYQIKSYTPKYNKSQHASVFSKKPPLKDQYVNIKYQSQSPLKSYRVNNIKTLNTQFKACINDFTLGKNLGQGKFGTVYLGIHKSTGSIFAIKKVPKKMIKQHFLVEQFILEMKIQSYFKHQNILQIYGFFDDNDSIYLILQYMEQGTLFTYFKKNKTLTEADTALKIKQLCVAVKQLHNMGVAHRDIKPQNIVMTNNVCKLCDFGWATFCDERRKTYCGTFDYAAPQILQGVQYDMSVDLWCIGILAYELLVGKAPFYHISRKQTMKKILNVDQTLIQYPQKLSKNARSFIDKLIIKNPDERMKTDQLLDHPFLDINQQ